MTDIIQKDVLQFFFLGTFVHPRQFNHPGAECFPINYFQHAVFVRIWFIDCKGNTFNFQKINNSTIICTIYTNMVLFTLIKIFHQHIPHRDDVTDTACEHKEVEYRMHVFGLVQGVEHGSRDVAYALGNEPDDGR